MKKRNLCMILICLLVVSLTAGLFSGCGQTAQAYCNLLDMGSIEIRDEAVALSSAPAAISSYLFPTASGVAVKEKNGAIIDYSNIGDGYVMAKYLEQTKKTLRVQVEGPSTKYTYYMECGEWETYPLSDGNGSYKVSVFQNVEGNKYSKVTSVSFDVALKDEFAPYLYSNQYVNYENAPETLALAEKLLKDCDNTLDKVSKVYDYVVSNFTYDDVLAETVGSGYLPNLDRDLELKKGICFDYAAMMAGMLRSQKIPVQLVVGYADDVYHAWLNVYSEADGWVDAAVYFDGKSWARMDPTLASLAGNSSKMREFIGNGDNYVAKYFY